MPAGGAKIRISTGVGATGRRRLRLASDRRNVDPSPASRTFTVDTTAPTVAIATGPATTSAATTAVFSYGASPGDDVDVVECRLIRPDDADPAFAVCSSTEATYEGLAAGSYRFELRARDAVGNVSAVADWPFTVEAPAVPPGETTPPADTTPPGETTPPADTTPPGDTTPPAETAPPADTTPPTNVEPVLPAAPQIAGLGLQRTVFRAARSGPAFGPAKASAIAGGRGTWLRFHADRATRVELRISRSVNRRWRPLRGKVTRSAPRGTNRIPVRGRFRGTTLRPGVYRLSVTMVDRSTGAKTTTHRTFRIKR